MANPLLRDSVFRSVGSVEPMTVSGTINKSIILWFLLAMSAVFSWLNPSISLPLLMPVIILGFVVALIQIFNKPSSAYLSPIYAILEGIALGVISLIFERQYPGIVVNAVFITIAALICMLAAYKSQIIRATPLFKKVVILSTLTICVVYIIDLILNVFTGGAFPYIHSSGWGGIGISLFVVVIASLNLIIDFDMIARGASSGAPKYMEWYGAFALMVTLVWLYLEVLRLLAKMRD